VVKPVWQVSIGEIDSPAGTRAHRDKLAVMRKGTRFARGYAGSPLRGGSAALRRPNSLREFVELPTGQKREPES
jgi:hypothetical protein